MALSNTKIIKQVREDSIIEPFFKEKLHDGFYDITLDDTIETYQRLNNPINLQKENQIEYQLLETDIINGYHIKPGEYVIFHTKEKFFMPDNLIGRINPSVELLKAGLILVSSYLLPSFRGNLCLGLYNVTPNIIDIYPQITVGNLIYEKFGEKKVHKNIIKFNPNDRKKTRTTSVVASTVKGLKNKEVATSVKDEKFHNLIKKILE